MAATKTTWNLSTNTKKNRFSNNFRGNLKSLDAYSEENGKTSKWRHDYNGAAIETDRSPFGANDKRQNDTKTNYKKKDYNKWGHQSNETHWQQQHKKQIDLSIDDADSGFNINKSFAQGYHKRKRCDELQRIKVRYGKDVGSSDSSSDEDEDGNRLPQEFDKEFLRTLSCLKGKDPRIYDNELTFFANLDVTNVKDHHVKAAKKEKPFYVRDHEREMLLANDGLPDEERDNERLKEELLKERKTYAKEQEELKESFKEHLVDSDDETDLLTQRKKTDEETAKEEENYYHWLKGQTEHLKEKRLENDVQYLKNFWNKNKLEDDEQFFRDYILKKEYLVKDDKEVPSYEEIIKELDEDEEELEKEEEFEQKFNFRFEEPDEEFIKRYPRLMSESIRSKDHKRKEKRAEVRERRIEEKDKKREELKRLKALKRMEIMEKLAKIKLITGNDKVGLEDVDLEEDFDPEKHDRQMQEMFGDEYYGEGGDEEDKPEFQDEEEYENWDEWGGESSTVAQNETSESHCEDPDFNMDCDYDPNAEFQREMINSCKKRKKKMSKLAKALKRTKPTFDPTETTFEKYFDEYYQLDYEDIIGDLPCRFKYRKVTPNDFGLSVDEILGADDKELNAWCSLTKTCRYRSEEEEKKEVKKYKRMSFNSKKKAKILKSFYATIEENEEEEEKAEQNPGSKMKSKEKKVAEQKCISEMITKKTKAEQKCISEMITKKTKAEHKRVSQTKTKDNFRIEPVLKKKEKKNKPKQEANGDKTKSKKEKVSNGKEWKKDGKNQANSSKRSSSKSKNWNVDLGMDERRLAAFGINPKRYKNMVLYGKKK